MEKGKKGLVALSSSKKMPYLSNPKFLKYRGFECADIAQPFYELLYLPFDPSADVPRFKEQVKAPHIDEQGFVLYYAHQCLFTAKYVPLLEAVAAEKGVSLKTIRFKTTQQAQNALAPFTSYSLFYQGDFVTNEILSEKKFEKLIAEMGLA